MNIQRRSFLKRGAAGAALLAAGPVVFRNSAFAMNPSRFQEKSDISFVGSSAEGTRRKMITDVLEPWRQRIAADSAGKTILIKVNMVYWMFGVEDPSLSLTHVDAVRGCIDFIRSINADAPIIIGDCTAVPDSDPNGDISMMFEKAGYTPLTTEYAGVTLEDLSTAPSVNRQFWTPDFEAATTVTLPIISAYLDPKYYIISITRPKTHNNMVITGVNKNILMGAPLHSGTVGGAAGATKNLVPKQFMHGQNGWGSGTHADEVRCLTYNLYQLANVIYPAGQPALSILDAWEGMEGNGPVAGTGIMQYCAAAGIDPLAVDRIAAKLMGFSDTPTEPMNKETPSYTDMRALVWISNAGFGNYDLDKINFILGSISDVEGYVKRYTLSENYTGDPSYETEWTAGPPPQVLATVDVRDSRRLGPKPYLTPQIRQEITGGRVTIDFSLPVAFKVRLGIYNLKGAEIRTLGEEALAAGRYSMVWDGRDRHGSRVPAGKYVIKLGYDNGFMYDHITMVR